MMEYIVYILICGVVDSVIDEKQTEGNPQWMMYDTFFGANDGLRYFKERLGFKPYKINWKM